MVVLVVSATLNLRPLTKLRPLLNSRVRILTAELAAWISAPEEVVAVVAEVAEAVVVLVIAVVSVAVAVVIAVVSVVAAVAMAIVIVEIAEVSVVAVEAIVVVDMVTVLHTEVAHQEAVATVTESVLN